MISKTLVMLLIVFYASTTYAVSGFYASPREVSPNQFSDYFDYQVIDSDSEKSLSLRLAGRLLESYDSKGCLFSANIAVEHSWDQYKPISNFHFGTVQPENVKNQVLTLMNIGMPIWLTLHIPPSDCNLQDEVSLDGSIRVMFTINSLSELE